MLSITAIVPTYNGMSRIERTLNSLKAVKGIEEILVVDDGSEVFEIKSDGIIKVCNQDNKGRAGARNRGSNEVSTDLLWFFDDDMRIEIDSTKLILSHFEEHPNSILVGSQIEHLDDCQTDFQKYKRYLSLKWQKPLVKSTSRHDSPFITAANFILPKNIFDKLGGFNEELSDAEDYDLAIRAEKLGISIFYEPGILGWHLPPESASQFVARSKEYQKANIKVSELHGLNLKRTHIKGISRVFHRIFRSESMISGIDKNQYYWLPRSARYKLYDWIITAQIHY